MSTESTDIDSEATEQARELTRAEKVREYSKALKNVRVLVALGLIGAGAWLALGGYQIRISDQMKILGVTAVGTGLVASPAVIYGIKRIWTPRRVYVADINAQEEDGIDIWASSPDNARDLDVRDGQLHRTQTDSGHPLWVGRDFDPQESKITGTWRGLASDTEILNREQEIEANRGRLRAHARIGQELQSKWTAVADAIESSYWKSMTDETLDRTAFDSEALRNEVIEEVAAMEDVEMPDSVVLPDDVDSVEDLDTADISGGDGE